MTYKKKKPLPGNTKKRDPITKKMTSRQGPRVKYQEPGLSRKLGETKYKLLDLVVRLESQGASLKIFCEKIFRFRTPTLFELKKPAHQRTVYAVECKNGHRTSRRGDRIMSGYGCRLCPYPHRRVYSILSLRIYAQEQGGECLSTEYSSCKKKYKWKCGRCGWVWEALWSTMIHHKTWCRKCAWRLTGEANRHSAKPSKRKSPP